jgi:hypothetical protein
VIVDYSTFRPPIPLLKTAGVTSVGRYIGWDCEPGFACMRKNLTTAEAAALHAAGISVFLSFEYAADAALSGAPRGSQDGHLAERQLHDLGAPPGMAVYYAVDFDLADYAPKLPETPANARAKLGPVAAYFDGIHSVKPGHEVAAYGGFWAIRRLLDAGLIRKGWQTVAWSGGQWDSRAVLRQLASQVMGFADVDLHTASGPDYGQWPRPVPAPPPPAPGTGPYRHAAGGKLSLAQIAAARGTTEAHLRALSETAYPAALARRPLAAGTEYWTSLP